MRPDNWFFAIEGPEDAKSAVAGHVRRLAPRQPDPADCGTREFRLSGGRSITLLWASEARAIESARFWIIVAGPLSPDAALANALRNAGSEGDLERLCTSPESGARSFLVIDKEARALRVITDHANVSKVFHAEIDGLRVISSHITPFPRDRLTVDLGAVASYLLNGACHNNRTVFNEVAILERAAVHDFRPNGRKVRTYWEYAPGRTMPPEPWQPQAAEAALWEGIAQSVDKATKGKRVLLGLSGGYDSAVLIGAVGGAVKHPDVTCFSYFYGTPTERSDVTVAARRAAHYGYRHVTLNSYPGDLLGMLDSNAAVGQALRCPSYEIAAFPAVAEQLGLSDDCVVLFGDHSFGLRSFRLRSPEELLGAIYLKSPALLNGLGPAIGVERLEQLQTALDAEHEKLLAKARNFASTDDATDFLYVDQRMQFNLLPLRTFVAGHWLPVSMPLLNADILDLLAAVPTGYRLDKRLFRGVGRRFLPELLRIPLAREGRVAPDFTQEIVSARRSLEGAILERGWKVDGLVGPEDLVRLLDDFCAGASEGRRGGGARAAVKSSVKALLTKSRFLEDRQEWLRRLVYNEYARLPTRWFLLLNLLGLADFLADRPPPAVPKIARRG